MYKATVFKAIGELFLLLLKQKLNIAGAVFLQKLKLKIVIILKSDDYFMVNYNSLISVYFTRNRSPLFIRSIVPWPSGRIASKFRDP